MAGKPISVNEEKFDQEIKSILPIIVDFWAEWCAPCRMVAPVLEEIANEYGAKLKVLKVNVDNNQDLAARYQVMSIPTLLFLKNGKEIDKIVGAVPKAVIKKKLSALI